MNLDGSHRYPRFAYRTDPERLGKVREIGAKLGCKSTTKALDQIIDAGLSYAADWLESRTEEKDR